MFIASLRPVSMACSSDLVSERAILTNEESFQWSRRLAKEEGIVGGISSGANMCAAAKVAARPEFKGKRICVIIPSLGERYLSTPLFEGIAEGSDAET